MRARSVQHLLMAIWLVASVCASAQGEASDKPESGASTKTTPAAHAKGKHAADSKGAAPGAAPGAAVGAAGDKEAGDKEKDKTVYDFGLPTEDGKNLPLSEYKGKVLLIVNLARKSDYAAQLSGLQKLSDTFKDKGLVVLGVPSNDFGSAEPGTPAEVAKAYADAKVSFPVMQVSSLTGVHELPLFTYLAKNKAIPGDGLHWNYTKFLVDRKGKVVVRFGPEVAPDSLQMMATVQEVVDGTWKPKKPPEKKEEAGGDDDDEF